MRLVKYITRTPLLACALLLSLSCIAQDDADLTLYKNFNGYNLLTSTSPGITWHEVKTPTELNKISNPEKILALKISMGYKDSTNLSKFIGLERFKNLEYLSIHSSRSTDLPPRISALSKLKVLTLDYVYEVQEIPASLFDLKQLTNFKLTGANNIKSIPDAIGNLSQLEELELTGLTRLASVPATIGQLQKLRKLELSTYATIPETIGKLKSLEYLILDNSGAKPKAVYTLPILRYLWMNVNNVEDLEGISHLKNLEMLDMRSGHITEEIATCPRLRFLKISSNYSEDIPDQLVNCKNLEGLILWTWPALNQGLTKLNQLNKLKYLSINDCDELEQVPALHQLKSIRYLQLYGNDKLASYPEELNGKKAMLDRDDVKPFPLILEK
jgi:Leucine-rich repeat (LRR) protein